MVHGSRVLVHGSRLTAKKKGAQGPALVGGAHALFFLAMSHEPGAISLEPLALSHAPGAMNQ